MDLFTSVHVRSKTAKYHVVVPKLSQRPKGREFPIFDVIEKQADMQPDCQVLSHRAEIFRSKLIEDFHLLETMSEHGRKRAPVYNSSDVLGKLINEIEEIVVIRTV